MFDFSVSLSRLPAQSNGKRPANSSHVDQLDRDGAVCRVVMSKGSVCRMTLRQQVGMGSFTNKSGCAQGDDLRAALPERFSVA